MNKKFRDFKKKNLTAGALVRAHIKEGNSMIIKSAFVVESNKREAQLELFPLIPVYLLHSSTMLYIYESQILEVLSFPT